MKIITSFFLICFMLASSLAEAREPANLASAKQQLIRYHDSGAYMDDIADVMQKALRYLELRVQRSDFTGKPAIILDIDETSLSNYPDLLKLDFGGTVDDVQRLEDEGKNAAIAPTLKLYRFAKENKIAVIFITGRFEEERGVTAKNLEMAGFRQFDGLILREGKYRKAPAAIYKTAARKALTDQGYDIILNIGDQKSDLHGGYADETYKVPNPYYLIP